MRFMILVKATEASEAGGMTSEQLLSEQVAYHEEPPKFVPPDLFAGTPFTSARRQDSL